MLLDHGYGRPAVIRQPLDVDAIGQAHGDERVPHGVNSYHMSLTRKSPEEMVDEVLTNILNTSKQTKQGAP
jgi:hypothetical protein